jgi:glycosyltransferase involved in cell wall biosynthesis
VRDLTLCLPFYMNGAMLREQYAALAKLPEPLKEHLRLIVVDDGSPSNRAKPPAADIGVSVQIFRFLEDIPWNQDAARNLAAEQAETDWLILTDIDHVLAEQTFERVIVGKLRPDNIYKFGVRLDAPGLAPKLKNGLNHPHPNSWVMTRAMYEAIGGYDEALAGYYGTDGDFARRAAAKARIDWLPWPLIRYPREIISDASTTTLDRKNPEDKAHIREITRGRGSDWRPMRNRWPWERVF